MNLVVAKHRARVEEAIRSYRKELVDLQSDIVIRAMTPQPDPRELKLLRRLEEEYGAILQRFENLSEAIEAISPNDD